MSTSNIFVAHPPTCAAPTNRVTLVRMLAVLASLLLVSTFVLSNSRAAFTGETSAEGSWDTAEVTLDSDAPDGVAFSTAEDGLLVPGDVITREVEVIYNGSAESVDVMLRADDLVQDKGLAEMLDLTIHDGTNTYEGTLAELAALDGVLAWPDVSPEDEPRTYEIKVEVNGDADNAYANGSASVDFTWHAESNPTQGQS